MFLSTKLVILTLVGAALAGPVSSDQPSATPGQNGEVASSSDVDQPSAEQINCIIGCGQKSQSPLTCKDV
ncbi:hypothetical protein NP233_g9550 [Leucocoprinus birnbaumii]|uniref:Uncharacterized protein n=1 Tax=Leucocoprinus birnbaumii TaxID=56174 RepID=A0AAD5YQR4_9AGAR|nr:hypothetical protein NP233_g9550 [Leucocoprinus birnbaumii]